MKKISIEGPRQHLHCTLPTFRDIVKLASAYENKFFNVPLLENYVIVMFKGGDEKTKQETVTGNMQQKTTLLISQNNTGAVSELSSASRMYIQFKCEFLISNYSYKHTNNELLEYTFWGNHVNQHS